MGEITPFDATGKTALVQQLFVQHASQLRGFVVALMPDLAAVDDVLQETFMTVTAKANVFDEKRDFLAWACGIARFKVMEAGRKARRWQPLSEEVLEALAASEPPADPADNPRLPLLADCLQELAPQSRRMIDLYYQQIHKPAEIAQTLGWAPESVYVALSRARAFLRQCVERKTAAAGVET
ncbi:MAG: sigma-70 family RNA polymerase sigma factor [Verrucomicrobiota bacterium]